MFNALLDLFKPQKQINKPQRAKPLHVSRQIFYRTTPNNFFNNQTPDVTKVFENASKLPLMQGANLSFCEVSSGATFVGFNRPKKVCGYVIVYPSKNLKEDRLRLFKIAKKNLLNIGTLTLNREQKCIQVKHHGKRFFLVDPKSLRLRGWSYKSDTAAESLPRQARPG